MAITERQAFALGKVGPVNRAVLLSAYDGTANTGQVVKAFCAVCKEGSRDAVTNCTDTDCTFFRYRPRQTEGSIRDAIKKHCMACKKEERTAVIACTTKACALNMYRPWQNTPLAGHDPLLRR